MRVYERYDSFVTRINRFLPAVLPSFIDRERLTNWLYREQFQWAADQSGDMIAAPCEYDDDVDTATWIYDRLVVYAQKSGVSIESLPDYLVQNGPAVWREVFPAENARNSFRR